MKTSENSLALPRQATDVSQFFIDITEAYLLFEGSILHLLNKLPAYTPEQILLESKKLGRQRVQLSILDDQMLEIIELAGAELARTHLVHDYRVAFAKASMASNNLYQKLLSVWAILQDESTNSM